MTNNARILVWCQACTADARIRLGEYLIASSASGVPFDVHFSAEGVRVVAAISDASIQDNTESESARAYLEANGYASSYAMIGDALQYAASVTVCATWLRACGVDAPGYTHTGTPVVIAQAVANGSVILVST